jgi:uncharacterized protein (TIGR02246 family)
MTKTMYKTMIKTTTKTTTKTRFTTAVVGVALLAFVASAAHAQSAPSEADSAALKQLVSNFTKAFNDHNAQAQAALFAENADFTNLRGASQHGRQEIETNLGKLFQNILKNASRTDMVRSIRMLAPAIAAVDSDATISGSVAADGKPNPLRHGLMSLIAEKQRGKWLIVIFHEQDFPPAPPATTSSR